MERAPGRTGDAGRGSRRLGPTYRKAARVRGLRRLSLVAAVPAARRTAESRAGASRCPIGAVSLPPAMPPDEALCTKRTDLRPNEVRGLRWRLARRLLVMGSPRSAFRPDLMLLSLKAICRGRPSAVLRRRRKLSDDQAVVPLTWFPESCRSWPPALGQERPVGSSRPAPPQTGCSRSLLPAECRRPPKAVSGNFWVERPVDRGKPYAMRSSRNPRSRQRLFADRKRRLSDRRGELPHQTARTGSPPNGPSQPKGQRE